MSVPSLRQFARAELRGSYLAVNAAIFHKFFVCAQADHIAAVEHGYLICVADSAYALRHDYFCRTCELLIQTFAQLCVSTVIERRERVVKNKYLRLTRQRTRYRKALLLTTRNVSAHLRYRVIAAALKLIDKLFCLRNLYCRSKVCVVELLSALAEKYVFANSAREEHAFCVT